jgi:hypothetical protein
VGNGHTKSKAISRNRLDTDMATDLCGTGDRISLTIEAMGVIDRQTAMPTRKHSSTLFIK